LRITKDEALKVIEILKETYPNAKSGLKFTNPFELLIATILSAQCTDKRVNIITDRLFNKYKTPEDFLKLTPEELQEEIRECGLYRSKSKSILETCKILKEKYDSKVPETLEELMTLPGVGRKTANVVLSNAFLIPAIAVDTHVFRVSRRLGLSQGKNPDEVEKDLMKIIPEKDWQDAHHWLIWHGRRVCKAQNPNCLNCSLSEECSFWQNSH